MPETAPILLCAATPWEARPLAAALSLRADGPRRWSGVLGSRRTNLLETGMGAAAAEASLSRANGARPALVVSTGLCGALQPGLRNADIVMDLHGATVDLSRPAIPAAARAGVRLHIGAFAHAESVLTPAQKRALGERTRAAAVDMESVSIRRWAQSRGSSFLTARAVLDPLDRSAPSSAPDGPGLWAMVRFIWAHASEIPLLAATGFGARRAMDALGRFLPEYLGDDADAPEA